MNGATPYRSPEFVLGHATSRPAAAMFGNMLWVFAAHADLTPAETGTFDLHTLALEGDPNNPGKLIDIVAGAAADPSKWTSATFQIAGFGTPQTAYDTAPTLATNGTDGCFVWAGPLTDRSFYVSRYTDPGNGMAAWQPPLQLLGPTGQALWQNPDWSSDNQTNPVAATMYGDDVLLVAVADMSFDHSGGYLCSYNIADIAPGATTWQARSGATLPAFGYSSIALDWINGMMVPPSAPSDTPLNQPPPALLAIGFDSNAGEQGTAQACLAGLDSAGNVDYPDTVLVQDWTLPAPTRDPAGRLCAYANATGTGITRTIYSSAKPILSPPNFDANPAVSSATLATADSVGPPTAVFVTDFSHPSAVTLGANTGTSYPVYEFLFYNDVLELTAQVGFYGTSEIYPEFGTLNPVPKAASTLIVGGIVDGPVPIPNANLACATIPPSGEFATFGYGISAIGTTEHTVSNSWTFGFKSEGHAEKGFGPAWNIALNGGTGSVNGQATSTTLATALTHTSVIDEETRGKMGAQAVLPDGQLFGTEITFTWTAFRFRDATGTLVVDGTDAGFPSQAALSVAMSTITLPGLVRSYLPYAVDPGDLDSYTVEKLNARMKTVYGYAGADYFHEVILPNAYPFTPTQSYLAVSWDNSGGQSGQNFEKVSTHFTESSWTLDSEIYVGVSGGGGATIFGMGEEMSFQFLIGGTYSHEATDTATSEQGWSCGLMEPGLDLPPADTVAHPKAAVSYSFRIYFLPVPAPTSKLAPNYWVSELLTGIAKGPQGPDQADPKTLDPNACAWKIMFVVDNYLLGDGTIYRASI